MFKSSSMGGGLLLDGLLLDGLLPLSPQSLNLLLALVDNRAALDALALHLTGHGFASVKLTQTLTF